MTRRATLFAAVLAAVAAVFSAACVSADTVADKAAKNRPRPGGTLRVGITTPGTVEPSNAYEPMGTVVASLLCDTLVQLDPVTGEPKPAIADAWVVSDSGKRFTIKLRKGVRFHGGRSLTASDVVYSLNRLASQDNASFEAKLMSPVIGYEKTHGDEPTDNARHRRELIGANVIEGQSLEIRLLQPNADFMRVLAHVATAPVSRRAAEKDPDAFARRPDCAGPYRITKNWSPSSQEITLRRHVDYYAKNKGYTAGGAGYFGTIVFKVFKDQPAAIAAYQAGVVDVTAFGADQIQAVRSLGADLEPSSRGGLEYIGLPTGQEPFDDPALRRALSMALDRPRAITAGLGGAGIPATGFLPPNVADVFESKKCGRSAPATPDVAAAKALLDSARVRVAGLKVKLYFNDEYGNRALVQDVAEQWRAAFGLDAEPTPVIWDKYLAQARSATGFDGPFRGSWRGDYAGADAYLHSLFHTSEIGDNNFARFSDTNFDRAVTRDARETADDDARRFDYRNLERILCERMPIVPVAFVHGATLVRKDAIGSAADVFNEVSSGLPALRELFSRVPAER